MRNNDTEQHRLWEEKENGRRRKFDEFFQTYPDTVIDFEPFVLSKYAIMNDIRQFGKTYHHFIKNGYDRVR